MKGFYLAEFEEIVLLSVCLLQDNAYGLSITDEINKRSSRQIHLSGVHTALYRLEEKGYVISFLGGATAARGGRRKRLFQVTLPGKKALQEARDLRNQFWSNIPAIVWEGVNI